MDRVSLAQKVRTFQRERWQDAKLFRGFDEAELDCLGQFIELRVESPGATIVHEGDAATHLFFIQCGRVEILKREARGDREHRVALLGKGETMGEMALVDELPRTASARARGEVRLVAIPVAQIRQRAKSSGDPLLQRTYQKLVLNMSEYLVVRLREKADESLSAAQGRAAVGRLVVNLLTMLSLYVLLLGALPYLEPRVEFDTAQLSIPIQLVFGYAGWRFIRSSGYPLGFFGIRRRGTARAVFEAVLLTLPLLLLVTLAKWSVIAATPEFEGLPLFEHTGVLQRLLEPGVYKWLVIYSVSSIVQELTVRGALQSTLEMFLIGPSRRRNAVFVSALLFSVCHLHMSFLFAALAFLPGLYWGWLFSMQRNLAGVVVSHQLAGAYVFFILGSYLPG
jgi:hypothetical protein